MLFAAASVCAVRAVGRQLGATLRRHRPAMMMCSSNGVILLLASTEDLASKAQQQALLDRGLTQEQLDEAKKAPLTEAATKLQEEANALLAAFDSSQDQDSGTIFWYQDSGTKILASGSW